MLYRLACVTVLSCLLATRTAADDGRRGTVPRAQFGRAYQQALLSNVSFCQQWLDEADFKSLGATADVVRLIALLGEANSLDKQWSERCRGIASRATALAKAAAAGKASQSRIQAEIKQLQNDLKSLKPPAKAAEAGKKAAARAKRIPAGAAQWMAVLDAVYTDAKASISFGEPTTAKDLAVVLGHVGTQLGYLRRQKAWTTDCQGLVAAAQRAAGEKSNQEKDLRARFKQIYQNCASCHERR